MFSVGWRLRIALVCLEAAVVLGCGANPLALLISPTPTQTPTPSATATPTEPPTPTATPAPTLLPTPTLADGWIIVKKQDAGFSVAIPPGWEQIDLDPKTTKSVISQFSQKYPAMANFLESQTSALSKVTKFYALDLSADSLRQNRGASITISQTTLDVEYSVDVLGQINAKALENLLGLKQPIPVEAVMLPAGEARMMEISVTQTVSGQDVELVSVAYLLVDHKDMYIMSFGTRKDSLEVYRALFGQIAQTFWILGKN